MPLGKVVVLPKTPECDGPQLVLLRAEIFDSDFKHQHHLGSGPRLGVY